jgi:hypothetical protein
MMKITKEEKNAINTLQKLAKKWPSSLWLFSASGCLCVMKKKDNGERAILPDGLSMDQDYCINTIDIENEGGDW